MMKIIKKFITLILLSIIGFSSFNLYSIYKTNTDEERALQKINEIATPKNNTVKKDINRDDIIKMKEINSDIVGYLKFDTEIIKEPVVQTTDNSYYLTHDVNRSYNDFGTVFMNKDNSMNDTNLVLYGHAGLYAGTQKFSNLNLLLNNSQKTQENCYFNFYTENEIRRYQISYIIKNANQDTFNHQILNFGNEEEFNKWITFARDNNTVDCLNEIHYSDKFMTLQTCIHGGGDEKVIVIAKEIERKNY